jgi:hypothetical protein
LQRVQRSTLLTAVSQPAQKLLGKRASSCSASTGEEIVSTGTPFFEGLTIGSDFVARAMLQKVWELKIDE